MKLKTTILFGGLLALAMSMNAESTVIKVNVPFAFLAGSNVMPAGSYTIEEPTGPGVLLLRGNQPNSTAIVIAVNGGPTSATQAAVTFSRRGSDVVLSTVSIPGGSSYLLATPQRKTAAAVKVALPGK